MTMPTLTGVERPRAFGYDCALDDILFRLAVGPERTLNIRTAPLEAPRINTTSSAEEAADEFGLVFARSQFDGGAGLFRAHVEGAEPNRFWDSGNVSVTPAEPGEFPSIRLLNGTALIEASTDANPRLAYDDVNGVLYSTEGAVLRSTSDPLGAAPSVVTDDPAVGGEVLGDIGDVAVLGSEVYVATGSAGGVNRKSAGVWANWDPVAATRLWAVKGRIVASDGRNLYELDGSGTTPAATLTVAVGEIITDVCDGGSHVLVASTDGYVYAFSTETGSLVLDGQTLFEGEQPQALGSSQGVVGVGTASGNVGRFYVGLVNPDNGQVVDLQLVRTWGDTGTATDQTPQKVIGTRSSLLTAVTDGTDTYLWRYDLITGGIARDLQVDGVAGSVYGIVVIEGRAFASVAGSGIWRQTTTYAGDGWLIGPLGDFFSSSPKSWVGARLETGQLGNGMAVELYYTIDPEAMSDPDSASWVRVERRTAGSGDPGEEQLSNVVARSLAGMVKLYASSDTASSPEVRSFSFRAYPSSGDEDLLVELPVNVSDQIERRGRRRVRVPGRGASTYATLRGFEGRPVRLRLFKPDITILGLVEEVATPIQAITRRGSSTAISLVRVRGRETGSGETTGVGTFGTYHLFGTTPTFGEIA
jgi:hypothetical protein